MPLLFCCTEDSVGETALGGVDKFEPIPSYQCDSESNNHPSFDLSYLTDLSFGSARLPVSRWRRAGHRRNEALAKSASPHKPKLMLATHLIIQMIRQWSFPRPFPGLQLASQLAKKVGISLLVVMFNWVKRGT